MSGQQGRRALPPDPDDADLPLAPTPPARRGSVDDEPAAESVGVNQARRGISDPDRADVDDSRRGWLAIAALGIVLALTIAIAYALIGERPRTTEPAPSPSPSPASSTPTGSQSGTPSPTDSPSPTASPSATDAATTSPAASPSPTPTLDPALLELNDTTLRIPDGWELYADEVVQTDRRLVRLRETATDVRVQAVTLPQVADQLDDACLELVADHRALYTDVAESLAVDVPITGDGAGVSCSFTGTRASDGQDGKVEFTVLRRASDNHSLVFRDTIPGAVANDDPVLQQLVAAECAAATTFGVSVDQCAAIPAPADG